MAAPNNNSNQALIKKYKAEPNKITPEEKNKLVIEYSPLIKFIAQKIAVRLPSNIELDDLISSGVIGLMDAIDASMTPLVITNLKLMLSFVSAEPSLTN